jgi:uncharacterized protein
MPARPMKPGSTPPECTERVYAELLRRAAVLLAHGESVVADASFLSTRQRAAAQAAAANVKADLVQLRCTAAHELTAERMRGGLGGACGVDPAIARQLEKAQDPWPEALTINTEDAASGKWLDQAFDAIRPDGPEHVWCPERPYMLPG